ncbi:glutamyl-tRNAGlu reductase, N-terminal domain protein, partial [Chlamydia psittaci C1/97]
KVIVMFNQNCCRRFLL